jgi:hypothetical protein
MTTDPHTRTRKAYAMPDTYTDCWLVKYEGSPLIVVQVFGDNRKYDAHLIAEALNADAARRAAS